MLINSMTLSVFSVVLNRYIKLDPQSAKHLAPLVNNVLCLDLSGTGKCVFFQFYEDEISVLAEYEGQADTSLIASPVDLAKLFMSTDNRLLNDNVRMEGKVRVAQDVQMLFSSLDIDWEEQLAKLTGDVFAYHASQFAGKLQHLIKDVGKTLRLNTVEFLQEEAQVLAVPERVTRFCESVDEVVMHTERLSVRIAQLTKKIASE